MIKLGTKTSVTALVLTNLIPVFGVLFFNWDLSSILFLYWFENIVIGFYNSLKMIKAEKPNQNGVQKTVFGKTTVNKTREELVGFFILHYGMFTLVHGFFLFGRLINNLQINPILILNTGFLFLTHGLSYFQNYLEKKEYQRLSPEQLISAPYKRVITMHLVVLAGSRLILKINGQAIGPLIVLVLVKTTIDFFSHNLEHNKIIPVFKTQIKTARKEYFFKPKLTKLISPRYENVIAGVFKKAIETGQWEKIKEQISPQSVKIIENYWREHPEPNNSSLPEVSPTQNKTRKRQS
ncbi:MAG: hypothetical protein JW991_01760 [Candidatus Pacebacteria bacterium]|nr:hypothetical protein [Candidatus Paceibacterota bacterium]